MGLNRGFGALGATLLTSPVVLGSPGGCSFGRNAANPPFTFYRGSRENRSEVQAELDPDSGLCVFPKAASTCMELTGSLSYHVHQSCCQLSNQAKQEYEKGKMWNSIVCPIAITIPLWLLRFYHQKKRSSKEIAGEIGDRTVEDASDGGEHPASNTAKKDWCKVLRGFVILVGFAAAVGFEVAVSVIIAQTTQEMLPVPARNSMVAADSFIVPIKEAFLFLNDAVLIKVNIAMATGAVKEVRKVMILGTIGGLILGTVAALVLTGITFYPPLIEFLLAPYAQHSSSLSCPLVPHAATVVDESRAYVLLRVWKWPFEFMNMALAGFFLGAGEWPSLIMMMLAEHIMAFIAFFAWFKNVATLETLGWIYFSATAFGTAFMTVAMLTNLPLRRRYGLLAPWEDSEGSATGSTQISESSSQDGNTNDSGSQTSVTSPQEGSSVKSVLVHGMCAMVLDVSVQMSLTIGVYFAGVHLGIGAMYQISSLQAAFMIYGVQYIWGVALVFKFQGSAHVARKEFKQYYDSFKRMLFVATALAVSCAATMAPYHTYLGFQLGEQACEYASMSACAPVYSSVFGSSSKDSPTALQESAFIALIPAMCAVCYYRLFKSGLYVSNDWTFMAKAGSVTFVVVFVPAILVVSLAIPNTTAIFIASHLPFMVLGIVFAWRTHNNIQKMLSGQPGPWMDVPTSTDIAPVDDGLVETSAQA